MRNSKFQVPGSRLQVPVTTPVTRELDGV